MIHHLFCIGRLFWLGLALAAPGALLGESSQISPSGDFAGWATNGPGVYRLYVRSIQATPGPALSFFPPPVELPPALRGAMVMFRAAANVTVSTNTTSAFDHYSPESLNYVVWTNFIAHTNGRSMTIWSERIYPRDWPAHPPVVRWNSSCLMWGMKGLTALSPGWEQAINSGQAPITALTRRHGYTLGHSMGPDRMGTTFAGKKVWFLTAQNTIVETKVLREVVRTSETSGRDYTIVLFSSDLPDSIQPMRVVDPKQVLATPNCKYCYLPGAPVPIFQTEQTGGVSAGLSGLILNVMKGGDSGSPNMIPLPGELVFWTGRTTAGASPEMQADMDELCRRERLDPSDYQLQWVDLSAYPTY